jgi:hypothetical protein
VYWFVHEQADDKTDGHYWIVTEKIYWIAPLIALSFSGENTNETSRD